MIEGSPLFRNPTFRAAVTPVADGGEQFSLGFEIEGAATSATQSGVRMPSERPKLDQRAYRRPEAK